jgi:tRNA-guanine family transglycosylase
VLTGAVCATVVLLTQAEEAGLDLMFCNTYHLLLQPGVEAVAAAGGLHSFMGRKRPIITDSGGFQVNGCFCG